jgi:hypothetical protein
VNKKASCANGFTSESHPQQSSAFIKDTKFSGFQYQYIIAMSTQTIEVFFFLTICTVLAWAELNCTCGLHTPGRVVKFKDCRRTPADWRSHDHPDLGITGDCLSQFKVPVK